MQRTLAARERSGRGTGVVVALTAVLVGAILLLLTSSTYDTWGAFVVAPVLIVLSLPALSRQAAREGDRSLYALLILALCLKLAGGVVRHFVAFDLYGGVADAAGYHASGAHLAEGFRAGHFATGLDSLTGTNFIRFLTGLIYTVTGSTQLGGFLVYSWLGFWGLFLFYRAFVLAVPDGSRRAYARLVFFLPSLLFWPSGIGKEAWMLFTLGIAAFGAARMLTGQTWRGLMIASGGLLLAAQPRPHVAGMLGLALVAGLLARRPRHDQGPLGLLTKGIVLTAVAGLAILLASRADEFLRRSGEVGVGVTGTLAFTAERTSEGGSEFKPSILVSPARAPEALVTVLYRPFPFEVGGGPSMASALEASFLLFLTLVRFRWVLRALGSLRRTPYVAFAAAYVGISILAFSSIANFGILARQRVQFLPLFLVLLAIPRKEPADARAGA